MKAMILAAGRGSRMQELSDDTSKVLLTVNGKALIEYHIENLVRAGVKEIIINLFYLPQTITDYLGDGSRYNVQLTYSHQDQLLGMGGGIQQALPLLGEQPFYVVSGDMWTDYDFSQLPTRLEGLAHLVLTDNPEFHPEGDFAFANGKVGLPGEHNLNYAGFGVFSPELFKDLPAGKYGIDKVILPAIAAGKVSGEHYHGEWANLNTAEQLQQIRARYEIQQHSANHR